MDIVSSDSNLTLHIISWITAISGIMTTITWLCIVIIEFRRTPRTYVFLAFSIVSLLCVFYMTLGFLAIALNYEIDTAYYLRPGMAFMFALFTGAGVFTSTNNEWKRLAENLTEVNQVQCMRLAEVEGKLAAVKDIEKRVYRED